MQSTKNSWEQLEKLQGELAAAEAVVIGAGAGLSAAAGFTYSGERFRQYFSDFEARYGFHDMYAGGFYPYSTPEEHWAYWSRYIYINRYREGLSLFMICFWNLSGTGIILLLRQMWITAFKRQALIKNGCFIPRGITVCFSAACPAVRKPLKMRR